MAVLAITATQVLPGSDAQIERYIAGAAITAGQPCYILASDGKAYLADADASAAAAAAQGIALNGAAAGQPVDLCVGGTITLGAGAAPVKGTVYVVGATAGAINPTSDLASGWYVTILGVGNASNGLKMQRHVSGIAV